MTGLAFGIGLQRRIRNRKNCESKSQDGGTCVMCALSGGVCLALMSLQGLPKFKPETTARALQFASDRLLHSEWLLQQQHHSCTYK